MQESLEGSTINLLDHGYVRLEDYMGNALTPVNAARCSFRKRTNEMRPEDQCLLAFLVENGHISPFRHVLMTFELCGPLQVARQIWRYTVGTEQKDPLSAWNEASYRYISQQFQFYVPADQTNGAERPTIRSRDPKAWYLSRLGRRPRVACGLRSIRVWKTTIGRLTTASLPNRLGSSCLPTVYIRHGGSQSPCKVWRTCSPNVWMGTLCGRPVQYAMAMMALAAPLFPESLSALYTTRKSINESHDERAKGDDIRLWILVAVVLTTFICLLHFVCGVLISAILTAFIRCRWLYWVCRIWAYFGK